MPSPTTKNTRYGALFPWNCEINPAVIGPTAQPIPKVVSYAPMIVPEISFFVFDRMVFNVSGKNMLNPKPISSRAIANSTIESETNAISNPKAMDKVAAISVYVVFLASFPAKASVAILEIPKIKNKT